MAWQGVKERPIFGWGQENYSIVYGKYFEARVHTFDAWSDRVGNIIFDQLIAGGFMGLFAYLSVFATVLGILWQRNTFCLSERALLSGLFAAYLFQNLFFHDSTASYILFGTVLAYIVRRSYRGTRSPMETALNLAAVTPLPYCRHCVVNYEILEHRAAGGPGRGAINE